MLPGIDPTPFRLILFPFPGREAGFLFSPNQRTGFLRPTVSLQGTGDL